ncbi:MAG: hypothetical protein ACTSYC_07640 [Promethearchaeota archaeon]
MGKKGMEWDIERGRSGCIIGDHEDWKMVVREGGREGLEKRGGKRGGKEKVFRREGGSKMEKI